MSSKQFALSFWKCNKKLFFSHFRFGITFLTYFRVGDGRRSLVLVVFIGGVTFAEISALRFLSAQVCLHILSR